MPKTARRSARSDNRKTCIVTDGALRCTHPAMRDFVSSPDRLPQLRLRHNCRVAAALWHHPLHPSACTLPEQKNEQQAATRYFVWSRASDGKHEADSCLLLCAIPVISVVRGDACACAALPQTRTLYKDAWQRLRTGIASPVRPRFFLACLTTLVYQCVRTALLHGRARRACTASPCARRVVLA